MCIEQKISEGMTKTAAIRSDIFETREMIQPLLVVMDEKEACVRTGRILASESTIYEWYRLVEDLGRHDWQPALLPEFKGRTTKYVVRIGNSKVNTCLNYDPVILQVFSGFYLDERKRTYTSAYMWTQRWATAKGLGEIPSIATLKRHLDATFPKQVQDLNRKGKGASSYKNAAPSQDRDVSDLVALEWINGDGWDPKNTYIIFPDGDICRPMTWFWQDIRTRKFLGFHVDKTENSDMLRLALRDVLINYGLGVNGKAFNITVDNTHAASAKSMTGGMKNRRRFKQQEDEPLGIYSRLGCEYHPTLPRHGQSKPIERWFGIGNMSELIDKHPKLEGAHIQSKTTVTLAQYIQIVQETVDYLNNRASNSSALLGKSPNQAFEESISQNIVLKATSVDIARLLQSIAFVTTHKDNGEIRLFDNKYWTEALIKPVVQNQKRAVL